jgi:hypothetical protein
MRWSGFRLLLIVVGCLIIGIAIGRADPPAQDCIVKEGSCVCTSRP